MRETVLKWFAAFIVCLILQTTLIPSMAIFGIQPDLPIIVLAFMCLKHGVMPGIYIGFFLGLCLDLYAPALLGQNALANTVIGFFLGLFNEKVMRTDPLMKIIILVVCFFIHDILFFGAELLKNDSSLLSLIPELFTRTLPRAIYSTVLALLIIFWNTNIKPNLKR